MAAGRNRHDRQGPFGRVCFMTLLYRRRPRRPPPGRRAWIAVCLAVGIGLAAWRPMPGRRAAGGAVIPPPLPPPAAADEFPGERWPAPEPADVGLDAAKLRQARDYALTAEGSGLIVRHGRVALAW